MVCPTCSHENEAGAKFCSNCGTSLQVTCPVCSSQQDADAKFCSNCGSALQGGPAGGGADGDLARYVPEELLAKIRSARAGNAMQGERRTVTMLFADVQGSTAAAENLDPEDWADIINGAFERLIAPVYRYEGTLARLQGDAVLAFFGAPIAHEDDPVRAVRAGLEIVQAIEPYESEVEAEFGVSIAIRVGINTGLVVVGEVGSDLRVEYSALGDAINVAARMEQTADPGTVRVTADTLALIAEEFDSEELGPVEVKGKSKPVQAHRVLRFKGQAHPDRLERALVGRDMELEVLDELRGRLSHGNGWIGSIIGEAGVGKSRILEELRLRSADAVPMAFHHGSDGELSWMFGKSRSYDASIPYSTIRDLLRRWWQLEDADDPFGRITAAVQAVEMDTGIDAEAYLGHVAGASLPDDLAELIDALEPPALNGRIAEITSAYMAAEASRRPAFIVLEDLHWADPMSLALIDSMMDMTDRFPVGLMFTMRPYRDEPTWHIHEVAERDHPHRYQQIALTSLGDVATVELLDGLLQDRAISDLTKERIVATSDGNPLFIEEMVRSLSEHDTESASESQVPTSLASMLTARLDRLSDESKLVAQMASVLGSEFDRAALSALAADQVDVGSRSTDLLRRQIFVELQDGPRRSLTFHHALMREAVYSTILRRTRRELHRRVADYLIEAEPDGVQEIARHLVEAADQDAAFPYLVEAGGRAIHSMALSDAIRFFTAALDNIPEGADPEFVVKAHDGLGEAHSMVPDLSLSAAAYQRLYEYGEQVERPSAQVTALNRLAFTTATLSGDLPKALNFLEDARTLAEANNDESGLTEYHMNACFVASLGGHIEEAVAHDEETVRLAESQGVDRIRLEGMVRRADNYLILLDFDRGIPALEEALEVAGEAGATEAEAVLRGSGAALLRLREADFRGALEIAVPAQETLARYASFYTALSQVQIALFLRELGDIEAALGRLADARRVAERSHLGFFAAMATSAMGHVYAEANVVEPIASLRSDTLATLEQPLAEFMASTVWADLGFTNLVLGRPDDANADFEHGLTVSSATRFWEHPRLRLGKALASIALGDLASAHDELAAAEAYVQLKDLRTFDTLVSYTRGRLLFADGAVEDAAVALGEAQTRAMSTGQRLLLLRIGEARSQVAMVAGDPEEAAEHAAAARSVVETIAESIVDTDLRESFKTAWLERLGELVAGT